MCVWGGTVGWSFGGSLIGLLVSWCVCSFAAVACMYVRARAYVFVCVWMRLCVRIACVYACAFAYVCAYSCVCSCVCACVCVCVCLHLCLCTHTVDPQIRTTEVQGRHLRQLLQRGRQRGCSLRSEFVRCRQRTERVSVCECAPHWCVCMSSEAVCVL